MTRGHAFTVWLGWISEEKRRRSLWGRFARVKNIWLHILKGCDIKTGYRIQDTEYRIQDTEYGIQMEIAELKSAITELTARIEKVRDWL